MKDSLQRRRRRLACRDPEDWDERVAREAARQGRIEAAFDRADLLYSVGDLEPALEWLQAAEALSGDLPPTYRRRRAQMVRDLAGPLGLVPGTVPPAIAGGEGVAPR